MYASLASKQAEYYKATLERSIFGTIEQKITWLMLLLLIDLIENKKKDDDDKSNDEATPTDTKRWPARLSSEKAKKRLK